METIKEIENVLSESPTKKQAIAETKIVRLKRSKGKVVQGCDIYIGRKCTMGGWNLSQSKWSNPFSVTSCGSSENAVKKYREFLLGNQVLLSQIQELKGKILGCWCKPHACHGDVLLELLNKK